MSSITTLFSSTYKYLVTTTGFGWDTGSSGKNITLSCNGNPICEATDYCLVSYGTAQLSDTHSNLGTGTFTMSNSAKGIQVFNGTGGGGTVLLPNTTTLILNQCYVIYNNTNSGTITVRSNAGGNPAISSISNGALTKYMCINNTTDAPTSWVSANNTF